MNNIRLICLNVAGNQFPGVKEFLRKYKKSTELFCFQEVISTFVNGAYPKSLHRTVPFHSQKQMVNFPIIVKILGKATKSAPQKFVTYHSPHNDLLETFAPEGNMMAWKYFSDWSTVITRFEFGSQDIFALENRATNVVMQWLFLESVEGKKVLITNLHGLWEQSIKGDTVLKLEQSKRIIKVLQYLKTRFESEIIMVGDFNLLPSTESIRMIELFGLRNLITEYGIVDTRTEYYKKELRYADYVFVSSGITVNTFKVLPDVVSDHAPLQLNFSIL